MDIMNESTSLKGSSIGFYFPHIFTSAVTRPYYSFPSKYYNHTMLTSLKTVLIYYLNFKIKLK